MIIESATHCKIKQMMYTTLTITIIAINKGKIRGDSVFTEK